MGLPARCTRSSPTTSPQGPPSSPTDGPVTWASTRSATRMIGAVNAPPRPWARTSASCCRECTASRPWPNGGCFPPTKSRCTAITCLDTWPSSASGSTVAAHAAAVWSPTGCSNWPSATTQSVTSSSLRAPSRRRSGRPLPETEATRLAWTAPAPDDPGATRPDEAKSAQMDSPEHDKRAVPEHVRNIRATPSPGGRLDEGPAFVGASDDSRRRGHVRDDRLLQVNNDVGVGFDVVDPVTSTVSPGHPGNEQLTVVVVQEDLDAPQLAGPPACRRQIDDLTVVQRGPGGFTQRTLGAIARSSR